MFSTKEILFYNRNEVEATKHKTSLLHKAPFCCAQPISDRLLFIMNLKLLLPFDNFKLQTKLSQTEVIKRIDGIAEPRKGFRLFSKQGEKPYQGKLLSDNFEISRIISGRNSFLPIIKGNISAHAGQTEISIRMRPVIAVLVFMTFWLGAVGIACVGIIISGISQFKQSKVQGFSPAILIPFAMFVFGYGLLILSYRAESHKSKAFLKQLLVAEEKHS